MKRTGWMRVNRMFCATALVLGLGALLPLQAAPVTWYLSGGTFADGGTFGGSFSYDATALTSSGFLISVTGGGFSALTYDSSAGAVFGFGGVAFGHRLLSFRAGSRTLNIGFNPELTNAGGTSSIFLSGGNSVEFTQTLSYRNITGGTVSSTAPVETPEPATWTLVLCSIASVAGVRRWMPRHR